MRRLLIASLVAVATAPAAASAATAQPIPRNSLLAIDRKAGYRNFLPTRTIQGFAYYRWTDKGNVLRVDFRNKSGAIVEWRVEPMTGPCDAGKQTSYQLGGNKVWWAQGATEQYAWRCVFDQGGKPLRLEAATTLPPTKFAGVGLGTIVAHANRH
jgi:opacity protein-like surface antigen